MTMTRFFDLYLLVSLASLLCLGLARGLALYRRGIRVVAIDRERSVAQGLGDLAQVLSLLFWAYEVVAFTWPLRSQLVPPWLSTVLLDALWIKATGAVFLLAGLMIYALALRAFGASWRLGVDRETPGTLVTNGIFAWTRNPIYLGLDLLLVGSFLVQGRLVFLLLAMLNAIWFHALIRREEHFLSEAYGERYCAYCARVGRYVTPKNAKKERSLQAR